MIKKRVGIFLGNKGLLTLAGGALLLVSDQASAYLCSGIGNEFKDVNCDADDIESLSELIGLGEFGATLIAKDDDPGNFGQGSGGSTAHGVLEVEVVNEQGKVYFTYAGLTPQVFVEKADNWYSVYDLRQVNEDAGGTYIMRDFPDDAFCQQTGVECDAVTSHFAAYGVVPVPAAVWLFGSGLLGLVGVARRRKNA